MVTLTTPDLHRTTAYHPQANGVVERLHRQLKAALKARLIGPAWMDKLPLGLRSAPKEDLGCAPAELVYGTTIRVPGEFIETSTANHEPAASKLLTQLRTTMATLRPKQTSHHRQMSPHVPVELQDCRFVFIRHDTPCSARTMDPSEFWSELPSISRWTSMINVTQCPFIGLNLHFWTPIGACVKNQ